MSSTAMPHGREYSFKEIEIIIKQKKEEEALLGVESFYEHYRWKAKLDDSLHHKPESDYVYEDAEPDS